MLTTHDTPIAPPAMFHVETRPLQPLAALVAVGDLFEAAKRGVDQDVFGAYSRLLAAVGRELSDAPMWHHRHPGRELTPFEGGYKADAVKTIDEVIGAVLRNATARDRERHWREADGAMRSFAFFAARRQERLATQHRYQQSHHAAAGRDEAADLCARCADICDGDASYFHTLAEGRGW